MTDERSERLRRFLRDHVSGYEELETLLFIAREAERDWSDSEVAASLNAPIEAILAALESLRSSGIVAVARRGALTTYRYSPQNDTLRDDVAALQHAYSEERLTVMRVMSANALDRVRTAGLQRFADAFRLERSKK